MIILRKYYSKVEDEDYNESLEKERKENNAIASTGLPIILGAGGATTGALIGSASKNEKHKVKRAIIGALAGGATGTAGGLLLGRKLKKKNNNKYDKLRDRYSNASKEDKEYLRHKREIDEAERNRNRRVAAMVGAIA